MPTTDDTHELASQLITKLTADVQARLPKAHATTAATPQPRLLTVKDAARYTARSEQAVRHLIFNRDIPAIRTGRHVRLDRRDLDVWIERNRI